MGKFMFKCLQENKEKQLYKKINNGIIEKNKKERKLWN